MRFLGSMRAGPRRVFDSLIAAYGAMRRRLRTDTRELEALAAEKMRQVADLLENVDQGLFTFNPDLIVNPDHSARACSILRWERLQGASLADVLRMTPAQAEAFRDWIDVVRREHAHRRWSKLAKLAPVREIILPDADGPGATIEIDYRRILDRDGGLLKIMALAQDVTEKRVLERRLQEERMRHEGKVKIIVGVAGHAEEAVAEFLKDAGRRLDSMVEVLLEGGSEWKRRVFFDCHTLKGNAGGFGFEALAQAAQDFETRLQGLGAGPSGSALPALQGAMRIMDEERCKIGEVYRQLYGSLEKPLIRMESDKMARLQELAGNAKWPPGPGIFQELLEACRTLRYRSLATLAFKYGELLARAAQKLGKEADFEVATPDVELEPAVMLRVDEALVHLFRNALAHGIEDAETRARKGKGKGRIQLSYSHAGKRHAFSVRDDGNGIDGEALARKAVASGLMTPDEAAGLGPEEKVMLIFRPGLSTTSEADSISGQGQGMAIVRESLRAEGGDVQVETWAGTGTCFTLFLPDPSVETAPAFASGQGLRVTA